MNSTIKAILFNVTVNIGSELLEYWVRKLLGWDTGEPTAADLFDEIRLLEEQIDYSQDESYVRGAEDLVKNVEMTLVMSMKEEGWG